MRLTNFKLQTHQRISRVLIANRGEISTRVIRTAKRLGIETVAVYSDVDVNALHVKQADFAYRIGEASALSSYLNGKRIVEAAKQTGAQAIHPGYGFLSENAEFAELCAKANVKFIGPSVEAIRAMGQKNRAKEIMIAANVPTLPGYNGTNQEDNHLLMEAINIPVYGGGGKGMRITNSPDDFFAALESARFESMKAFGNSEMILEKFIEDPRHIEVQIFGDSHGNYVHLWERDCSIQRRHQKIIEEAPAPEISNEMRLELGTRAVDAARTVNYEGAGTVEFIMDKSSGMFYFMEMNTRLQVEHPVTEYITGIDLVQWQFHIAEGGSIPLSQKEIPLNGHAIEARIYAESFDRDAMEFMPSAGKLEYLKFPTSNIFNSCNVRVDTGVSQGDDVSVHYDPIIAKIIAHGNTRIEAITRLNEALGASHIEGVCSNINLVRACLMHSQFQKGQVSTGFVEQNKISLFKSLEPVVTKNNLIEGTAAMILLNVLNNKNKKDVNGPFEMLDFFRLNHFVQFKIQLSKNQTTEVKVLDGIKHIYQMRCNDQQVSLINGEKWTDVKLMNIVNSNDACFPITIEFVLCISDDQEQQWKCKATQFNDKIVVWNNINGGQTCEWFLSINTAQKIEENDLNKITGLIDARSPILSIVEKIFVIVGDNVKKDQVLAILNAMKMEFVIKAPCNCNVKSVEYKINDAVSKNAILFKLEAN